MTNLPTNPRTNRQDCFALDAQDPLAALRDEFDLPAGVIYLDGNSLGPLPIAANDRVAKMLVDGWEIGRAHV